MTTQLGMDPGMLTEEVEILEKKELGDGQGGRQTQYVGIPQGFESARIRPLSAWQRRMAAQSDAPAQYEVTMRFREGLSVEHRLRWAERDITLEITSEPLNLDERSDYLQFNAATART